MLSSVSSRLGGEGGGWGLSGKLYGPRSNVIQFFGIRAATPNQANEVLISEGEKGQGTSRVATLCSVTYF